MPHPPRSRLALVALSLAAALLAPPPARADKIVMATWGGASGVTWRKSFAAPFQAETGIQADVSEVPNPESAVRTLASKPQYNAAIVTYFDAVKLYQDGLIETFDASEIPEIANVVDADRLKAPDGRLLGAPVYYTYYGIAYNTDDVKPSEIGSWRDLADPRWKDRMAITQPIWLSAYQLTILSYVNGGSERDVGPGLDLFKSYVRNASVLYTSLAQLTQLLTRGEVSVSPFYLSSIWTMRHNGVSNVNILVPKEGALKLPYLVVVPKGSADRDAAKRWLNYVASAKPQARAATEAGYFPMNSKTELSPEFEAELGMPFAEINRKMIIVDWFLTAKVHKERTELVEKIIAEQK